MKAYDTIRTIMALFAATLAAKADDEVALKAAQDRATDLLANDEADKAKIAQLTSEKAEAEKLLADETIADEAARAELQEKIAALEAQLAEIGEPLSDAEKQQLADLLALAAGSTPPTA